MVTADNNAKLHNTARLQPYIFMVLYTPRKKTGHQSEMLPRAVKNPLSHQKKPYSPSKFLTRSSPLLLRILYGPCM